MIISVLKREIKVKKYQEKKKGNQIIVDKKDNRILLPLYFSIHPPGAIHERNLDHNRTFGAGG